MGEKKGAGFADISRNVRLMRKENEVTSHGMWQPLREPYSVFLRKSELPLRAMDMVMLGMIAKGTPTCHPVHE